MLTARQAVHTVLWAYRLLSRKQRPNQLDFIKTAVSANDICFDVGAHAGTWAYPLSKIAGHVYAFEALPYYAQVLKQTMKLLGVNNVTVVNRAVSNRQETVNLVWRDPHGKRLAGLTHVAAESEKNEGTVSVPSVSLDSYVAGANLTEKRVAFIKCDVEGYEYQVITGASGVVSRWRPLIFAEVQDNWLTRYGRNSADLINVLESFGYRPNLLRHDGTLIEISAASYSGTDDILFCPPDHDFSTVVSTRAGITKSA
jgi:FkbM family methyltransferase